MPDTKFHNIRSNTSKDVMILKTCDGRMEKVTYRWVPHLKIMGNLDNECSKRINQHNKSLSNISFLINKLSVMSMFLINRR